MLNKLYDCLDSCDKISELRQILDDIRNIQLYLESDSIKSEQRNDAIDAICEIFQSFKEKE